MVNLDFSPLYRSTVGFDRLSNLLQSAMQTSDADVGYPPYNIEKSGEDTYRIVVALAGFDRDDIEVVTEQNRLTVKGKAAAQKNTEYLHRGIAGRSFERHFDLAEHIEVSGAGLENGLLTIDLKREVPEQLKPRKIEIARGSAKTRAIEHSSEKAA